MFRESAGKTGLDNQETKMPSYWGMPFQSLCVGLKVGNNLNWALIPYKASSLYDVIADNSYRNFSIGRDTWLSLIGGSSFQDNCNAEGFNGNRTRIGINGNQEEDCLTADSMVGFGFTRGVACGNFCSRECSNGDTSIPAFGYILIK
jgi:hypothetical protein